MRLEMQIKEKNLLQFFLILPFMEPALFREIGTVHKIYMLMKIVSAAVVVLIYMFKMIMPSAALWIVAGYEGSILLSTILNHGDLSSAVSNAIAILTVSALIEYCMKTGARFILHTIYCVFSVFTVINLLMVLYHGITVGAGWEGFVSFLGIDNRFVFIFLPMIAFGSVSTRMMNRPIKKLMFTTFIAFLTLLYTWSIAAMAAIAICIAVIYILNSNLRIKAFLEKMRLYWYLLIVAVLNILIVFMHIQNYFYNFLVNYLHKDISLSGRIYLWMKGTEKIAQSPIIGHGLNEQKVGKLLEGLVHFHNYFINMLYQGGFLAFGFFLLLNIVIIIKTRKYTNTYTYQIISFIIFISLFLSVFDTLDYTYLYVFYIILGNLKYIEKVDIYTPELWEILSEKLHLRKLLE